MHGRWPILVQEPQQKMSKMGLTLFSICLVYRSLTTLVSYPYMPLILMELRYLNKCVVLFWLAGAYTT